MKYAIPFIAGIIIGWFIYQQCNRVPATDTTRLDSMIYRYDSAVAKAKADSITYAAYKHSDDSNRQVQSARHEHDDSIMRNNIGHLTVLVNRYKNATPTVRVVICDSVINLLNSAYDALMTIKADRDETITASNSRRFADSTEIQRAYEVIQRFTEQEKSWITTTQQLVVENNELRAALAKSKRGSKLLAVLGLVVGAGAVLLVK